ncbi:protein-N(5)-glutamine methyltransferase PrmC, methylates polypeptide chain release factors RF1 and RF2 [Hydrogenimonas sp.]|nr:protein-N(5)-glutamine methyltransferase PrmC, methylates polypeptide chain release factors RF1 and RF2 [Hydrogenimonas sp.]
MTVEEALREASSMLKGVAQRPRLEAEILLTRFLECDRTQLHLNGSKALESAESYFETVQRRVRSEPVEYITGRVSFYDIELEVGPGVLIARPETELLVDRCAQVISSNSISTVAEIGVGSGAVSIVLARMFPRLRITATDISAEALKYAKRNVERYGLEERIELVECSLLDGVDREVDMIVSNPPYISEEYELPPPLRYEPLNALVGGERGDEILKKIISLSIERRVPHLVCEMGYDQRKPVLEYCESLSLKEPEFYKDLSGLDRGFYLKPVHKDLT